MVIRGKCFVQSFLPPSPTLTTLFPFSPTLFPSSSTLTALFPSSPPSPPSFHPHHPHSTLTHPHPPPSIITHPHHPPEAINHAAEAWGLLCLRYEIKDIQLPTKVKEAMQMQVEAERKKRANFLESEGKPPPYLLPTPFFHLSLLLAPIFSPPTSSPSPSSFLLTSISHTHLVSFLDTSSPLLSLHLTMLLPFPFQV